MNDIDDITQAHLEGFDELPKPTRQEILCKLFEEHTGEQGHPLCKQLADYMFTILEEHNCCDTHTWHFVHPVYERILHAE